MNTHCEKSLSGEHYWVGGYWNAARVAAGMYGSEPFTIDAYYSKKVCEWCGIIDDKDYKENKDKRA